MTAASERSFTYPTSEDFAASLGAGFKLASPDDEFDASLIGCDIDMRTETTESFSLTFRATPSTAEQGLYRVTHEGLGEFDLFVVPVARTVDSVDLQAIFNLTTDLSEV